MAKINDWLEEDKLILLNGWARSGLSDEQIATNMQIATSTYYDWKKKYPEFSKAIKKGKDIVDFEVENALLKRALGYTITLNEQKVDKDGCVHDLVKNVHIPGDTTAQIFWLKNRKPKEWRDRVESPVDTSKLDKVSELLNKIEEEAKQ